MTNLQTQADKAAAFDRILQSAGHRGILTKLGETVPEAAANNILHYFDQSRRIEEKQRTATDAYTKELQELFPGEAIGNPMDFAIKQLKDKRAQLEAFDYLRKFGNKEKLFEGYDVESHSDIAKVFEMEIRYMKENGEKLANHIKNLEKTEERLQEQENELRQYLLKHTPLTLNNETPAQGAIRQLTIRNTAHEELKKLQQYLRGHHGATEAGTENTVNYAMVKLADIPKLEHDKETLINWNKELQAEYEDLFPDDKLGGSIHALVIRKMKELQEGFQTLYKQRTEALEEVDKQRDYAKEFENKWKETRSEARRWKDKEQEAQSELRRHQKALDGIENHMSEKRERINELENEVVHKFRPEIAKLQLELQTTKADLKASKKKLKGYKSAKAAQRTQEQRIRVARGIVSKLALSKHMDKEMIQLGLAVLSDSLAIGETADERSNNNGIIGNVWAAIAGDKPKTSTLDQFDALRHSVKYAEDNGLVSGPPENE